MATLVFLVFDVHLNGVADFQVGIVTKFANGDDAVALVANVYNNFAFADGNNCSFNYFIFVDAA